MSKTMSQPWLKLGLLDYLAEGTLGRRNNARQKSKTVQVIQSNEEFKFLTINDKNNYFTVFLTSNCIDDMTEKEITFARLKHTLIKLNTYHFSTIVANIGSRDEKKFRSLGISYPLALQCDNLMYLGGDDSDTIGEPRDLNKDDDVAIVYTNLGYVIMAQRLAVKQFPTRGALPNYDGKFLIVNRMTDEDAERFEDYIISDDQQLILDQLKDPIPVPIPAQKALQISNLVPHQPSTPSAGGRTILVSANKTAEKDIAFAARAAVAATLVSIGTAVVTSPTKKAASPTKKAASSHSTSEIGNNDMYLTQTESSHIQDLQSLLSNEMDPNTQIDETQRETTIDNVDDVDPSAGFELQAVDTSIEDTAVADAIDTETIEKETSSSASPKKRLRPAIILRRSNRIINSESWKKPISYADDTATPKRLRFNSQQTPQPALFMTVERVLDNQPTVDGAAGQILNSATRATDTSPVKAEESLGRIPEVEVEISSVHATSEEDANKDALAMEEDEGQSSSNWLTQPMTQDILHGSEESLMYSSQSETQQLFTQASSASPLQSNLELSCRSPRNKPSNPSSSAKEVRKRKETDSTSGRIMPPDAEFDPYYLNKKIIKQFGNHGLYKGKVLHYRGRGIYLIQYEDGDTEEMSTKTINLLIISSPAPSPTPVPPRFPSPAPAHFPSPSRQRVERRNEVDTEYESRHDNQLQIYESEKEERQSHYHSNPTHAMGRSSSSSSSSTDHGNKRQSVVRYSTGSDGAAKPRRDIGNLLVKHTTDEEGRPVKLRGVAADPLIYRLLRRICHADGGDSENDAGMRLGMGMGRSGAVSCGIKVDGTVVRRRQSMIQPLPYRVFPTGRASVKKSSTSLPSSSSSKSY